MRKQPLMSPKALFANQKLPDEWSSASVAFVCFTPLPHAFQQYIVKQSQHRYFLHSPLKEVNFCRVNNIPFIVLSEVYGFTVGSTTIEELVYYGIKTIIAIGYVGAFNGSRIGQNFIARDAMSDQDIAIHYDVGRFTFVKPSARIFNFLKKRTPLDWQEYSVWCTNSIYREFPETIESVAKFGCGVVNMDTLAVYACGQICASESDHDIQYIYVGTVTDSNADGDIGAWNAELMETIDDHGGASHNNLAKYMIAEFLPEWLKSENNL